MPQQIFSSIAFDGTFLAISALSQAALDAGMTEKDVIGKKMWEFNAPAEAEVIRRHFARCILDGGTVEYATASLVNGVEERWHVRLIKNAGPAHVACVGTQVETPLPVLGEREHELLRLLAADMTYAAIAASLSCPLNTLHHRLAALRKRFSVETNHGLVAVAIRSGLL